MPRDWILLDAWFRSRSLEHPSFGEAMIPSLDMVNHSSHANASYQPGSNDCVHLLLRPGKRLDSATEVTISYGEAKSKAEMLFSYGFVDDESTISTRTLTLPLKPDYPADPLGKAKDAVFAIANLPRTVEISVAENVVHWKSAFLYFIIVNEEDGLDFRVIQETDGSRGSLRVFWHDEDITETVENFHILITENDENEMREVFMLRAAIWLGERLENQLHRLDVTDEEIATLADQIDLDIDKQRAAIALREDERKILEDAIKVLDKQVSLTRVQTDRLGYVDNVTRSKNCYKAKESKRFSRVGRRSSLLKTMKTTTLKILAERVWQSQC